MRTKLRPPHRRPRSVGRNTSSPFVFAPSPLAWAVRRSTAVLALAASAVTLAGCGPKPSEDARPPVQFEATEGGASQAVALVRVSGRPLMIDGMAGNPPTLEVRLPNGTSVRLAQEVPMVGIQAWAWRGSVVIAGNDCPGFDPAHASGVTGEDCGGTTTSVVLFDVGSRDLDVIARRLPGEWPPGPILGNSLLVNGGRAELDLTTGKVGPSTPYPAAGALPCRAGADLVQLMVDSSDLQGPGTPARWNATVYRRSTAGEWRAMPAQPVFELIEGVDAAGVAGCAPGGPILWTYHDGRVDSFTLQLRGPQVVISRFAAPLPVGGPPSVALEGGGEWLAVEPVKPAQEEHRARSARISNGGPWSKLAWTGQALVSNRFLVTAESEALVVDVEPGHRWSLRRGVMG